MCIKVGQGEGCNLWMTRRHLQMMVRAGFQSCLAKGEESEVGARSPLICLRASSPDGEKTFAAGATLPLLSGRGQDEGLRVVQTGRP